MTSGAMPECRSLRLIGQRTRPGKEIGGGKLT
jgi:hypothetical protein